MAHYTRKLRILIPASSMLNYSTNNCVPTRIFFSALATSLRESAQSKTTTVTFDAWAKAVKHGLDVLYKCKCLFLPSTTHQCLNLLTFRANYFPSFSFLFPDTRARPPSRTLVDPLSAFTLALQSNSFTKAVDEAHSAAQATKDLSATAGRGAYVDQKTLKESGIPDPGAWGVSVILRALRGDTNA